MKGRGEDEDRREKQEQQRRGGRGCLKISTMRRTNKTDLSGSTKHKPMPMRSGQGGNDSLERKLPFQTWFRLGEREMALPCLGVGWAWDRTGQDGMR